MNETFRKHVESLNHSFEQLTRMSPVTISTLQKRPPAKCIYLFSENGRHLYVGRTRKFRQRLRQHSIPAAQHNQAVFAFKIAREATGRTDAAYSKKGSRVELQNDPQFAEAFTLAKARIRSMELRFVEEIDPLRQALLEIYVAVALGTPYNDFETH